MPMFTIPGKLTHSASFLAYEKCPECGEFASMTITIHGTVQEHGQQVEKSCHKCNTTVLYTGAPIQEIKRIKPANNDKEANSQ